MRLAPPEDANEDYQDAATSARSARLRRIWQHPTTIGIQVGSVVVVLALAAVALAHIATADPVPRSIRSQISFPIFYPQQSLLPKGFELSSASFKIADAQKDAIVYSINYPEGKIVVSVQPKPSANDLGNFVRDNIPINHQVLTPVGTAIIGDIGAQTVASLPTNENAWIIVTAPSNVYGSESFNQVLKSFIQPR